MSRLAIYLYGVMRAGTEIPVGLTGIDDDAQVCAFDRGRLAALTSIVARDGFESDGPADSAWVVPRALQHELVVETMLQRGPILPVRFGALFTTRQALEAWMSANHETIDQFLDHVAGKEEWTLKVHVELEAAFECLVAQEPSWAAKAKLLSTSPGARYFQEKRLREEARQHVRQRARLAAEMIRKLARSLAEERVLATHNPGRQDVEPVLHLAYLVPHNLVASFLDQVRQAAANTACLRLISSGPWPPAHFAPPSWNLPDHENDRLPAAC